MTNKFEKISYKWLKVRKYCSLILFVPLPALFWHYLFQWFNVDDWKIHSFLSPLPPLSSGSCFTPYLCILVAVMQCPYKSKDRKNINPNVPLPQIGVLWWLFLERIVGNEWVKWRVSRKEFSTEVYQPRIILVILWLKNE